MSPFLKKHDDGFVVDLRYNVPLIAEALDKFPEGLSLLLYDAGQVQVDSWPHAPGLEVVDELPA
jgi:hypothetical protein